MRDFKFYKDEEGWFVDLPEWEGEKWELQMVSGADTFLEILSQGESEVNIVLSKTEFETANKLDFIELGRLEGFEMGTGSWYLLKDYNGITYNLKMWLCDVTVFVFKEFPKIIYFK